MRRATNDRRLWLQVASLVTLAILPVCMIAINGAKAFEGILMGPGSKGDRRADAEIDRAAARPLRIIRTDAVGGSAAEEIDRPSHSEAGPSTATPDEQSHEETNQQADQSVQQAEEDHGRRQMTPQLKYGVYDPRGEFDQDVALKIRHVYVSWAEYDRRELSQSLASLEKSGYEIMLTIEPWPTSNAELLLSIVSGGYDAVIDDLAAVLNGLNRPIYVSWGHEMDQDLTERYPWSGSSPEQFIKAYRYVVDRFRKRVSTEIRWIWAGVMKDGSKRYWPGDDYVDFIGMPIYSFPAFDLISYGYIRDFKTTFEEKRRAVEGLDKPLMITELGVSGSPDFETFWMHQAFMSLGDCRGLVAVVFFYAEDVEGAWGSNLPTPDWRIHPDSIRGLVAWMLSESHSS